MGENRRTTYTISEAARELGISAEWLRVGGETRFLPCRLSRPQRPPLLHRGRLRAHAQRVRLKPPLGPCDDRNKRAVVGGYGVVPGFTRYPGSTSSAPNATTSAMVAEWTTSPCAYVWTVP